MADDKISFSLDLDVAEFTEKGLQAKGIIQGIGSSENLAGLLEGLASTTLALGAVGLALFAVKEAFDLTVEGEEIQRINDQFGILSAQAGISGKDLKEGLEQASLGLIPTTDLLKVANKALVTMGESASKIPEIMTLATKASQVFGGTAQSNFEALTQAVSTGNTRMLKHMGIVVDVNKAVRDFAAAQGIASNELSEAGRRQAILNAVLDQGNSSLGNVKVNLETTKNTFELFITTLKEMKEVVTIAFEKTLGPSVRKGLSFIKDFATSAKKYLVGELGTALKEHTDDQISNIHKVTQESVVDQEKRKSNEAKFQKELRTLEQETFKASQANVSSLEEINQLTKQQELENTRTHELKLQEIDQNKDLRASQRKALELAENARYQQIIRNQETETNNLRIKLLDTYKAHSDSVFNGIGRSFKVMSLKAKQDWTDFGKRGDQVAQSFQTYSTQAFESIGEAIGKNKDVAAAAADAMKGFFLNMLADRAIGEGQILLASGIWPPNPVALGAGAALITLGGALRAAGGSTGGSAIGAAGGGVGTGGIGVATTPAPETGPISNVGQLATDQSQAASTGLDQMQKEQRAVSVNIAGNYFDTDTTRKQLMEMIRQETNATDFQYNRIGV